MERHRNKGTDLKRRSVIQALAVAAALPGVALANAPIPIVSTRDGRVQGRLSGGAYEFLGIPYGAPTGGSNRFRAPQPVSPWSGIRLATQFGPSAPQRGEPGSTSAEPQSEDCLYLNVYTPALDRGRRPVMVFFHGGGFASGSGGARYNGERLAARHDVLLVTVNHRLNVLGFLDLSALGSQFADSANAGLLDLVAALRWVKDNIARFGGDPGNVTIFGQSGGGAKVSALLAMPAATGLFHRAIPMSGAILRCLSADEALELRHALTEQLVIAPSDINMLQSLPADRLVEAMMQMGSTGNPWSTRNNFGPSVDGHALPREPFDPDASPGSARVPLMVGSTHDETRLFYVREAGFSALSADEARARLIPAMKTDARTASMAYMAYQQLMPQASPAELFIAITTQYMFARNSVLTAERKARAGGSPAYLYRFDWVSPGPVGAALGASHATDIPLVMDMIGPNPLLDETPERTRMTELMSAIWTRFARTGDPNGEGIPRWHQFDTQTRPTMILNAACRLESDPDPALRTLYELLPVFHP